ncbi:MAG TPA: hypothetical protein DCW90_08710 [Lachnospiraceae bacterium]|nr:hypothetical protein [Lachnospiraceae bacterium]
MNACIIYAAISDTIGTDIALPLEDIAVESLDLYCKNYVGNQALRNRQILRLPISMKAKRRKNIRVLSYATSIPEHLIDFKEDEF